MRHPVGEFGRFGRENQQQDPYQGCVTMLEKNQWLESSGRNGTESSVHQISS